MNTPAPRLSPDCARCCGLCCVAPAFDAAQGFGFDKPAHVACAHLQTDFRCAIHEELSARGFPACAGFDCHGAGQRVTQELFQGRSWRDSPELAQQMFEAYARYRGLHELMALLEAAAARVPAAEAAQLRERLAQIDALCASRAALGKDLRVDAMRRDVRQFLRTLLQRYGTVARVRTDCDGT